MKKLMFSAVALVAFSFTGMASNSITKKENDNKTTISLSNEDMIVLNEVFEMKGRSLSECYAEGISMYELYAYGPNPSNEDPIEMAAWGFEVCMCNCLPEEGTY